MTRILFRHATIVTVDPAAGVIEGDLLVEDGHIAAIGDVDESTAEGAEIVDASDGILIPGLINAHIHLWETGFRTLGLNWTGVEFHLHVQTDFVPEMSPRDTFLAEYVGALSLLDGGTTGVLDWCHGNPTPAHSDAAVDALTQAEIRGVFAHGTVKTLPKPGEPHFSEIPHPRGEAERLAARFGSNDGRLRLALGILGPDYSAIDIVRQDLRLAADLGLMTTAHVSGNPGKVPDGYRTVVGEGLLQTPHNVVHANAMLDDELRLLIDQGASITATARTELNGNAREPLIDRLVSLGGRPSIGTDAETSTPGDMFLGMRDALLSQRMFASLRKRAAAQAGTERAATNVVRRGMEVPPRLRPSSLDALRWATIDNARALGIDDEVGSLVVGKRADIVMVRRSVPGIAPALNPIDAVVGFAHPGHVDTVLVDGEFVKRGGRLADRFGFADHAAELAATTRALLVRRGLTSLTDSATEWHDSTDRETV